MNAIELAKFAKEEIGRAQALGVQLLDTTLLIEWLDKIESTLRATEKVEPLKDFHLEAYKYQTSASLESFRAVIEIGNNALKTALGINGAASVALLAFIGHLATNPKTKAMVPSFAFPLLAFVAGVLAAALATGVTYITQSLFSHGRKETGRVVRMVAILLVVVSYLGFALGSFAAYSEFKSLR